MNLYNEIDPYCCDWLENLIREKLIPAGVVDRRSIVDIVPNDLRSFTQVHFFAGLGGWPLGLRRAGYPDHRAVWTGSCPCQPFSQAGKKLGFADDRHLWPWWRYLIAVCRPATIFGEQVASAPDWLGLVRGDLEALEYAVGAMPVEAASAGADHFRDRYWFVADGGGARRQQNGCGAFSHEGADAGWQANSHYLTSGNDEVDSAGFISDGDGTGSSARSEAAEAARHRSPAVSEDRGNNAGLVQHAAQHGWGEGWTEDEFRSRGIAVAVASIGDSQIFECPDGKWRRLPPPRVRWLGARISARVVKLRAFGNAIDPRPAAAFIKAAMESL